MFFEDDRIVAMREMILARDHDGRRKALDKLLPMQRQDFTDIFRAMDGLPVTIRLLDPPLHEFLPHDEAEIVALSESMSIDQVEVRRLVEQMRESNPMLGHRGCRLGMTHPEVTEMQARAIFEAACDATDDGIEIHAEVMVPLVATAEEMKRQADLIHRTAEMVFDERGTRFDYKVGTMIELPRAAINADLIAEHAEFFSFGTNDLTQTTFGLSRDDSGMFLPKYVEDGVIPHDPFQSIDARGVGRLIDLGVRLGRQTRNDLKVGICGEHGGDPRSIALCELIGLDYVSCSPFRVPIARLAAAHAHIKANLGTLNGDKWRLMLSPEASGPIGETES